MYNPEQQKERIMPKVGTQIRGQISSIIQGTLKDFVDGKILSEKWKDADPDQEAIEIHFDNNEVKARKVMTLPSSEGVHPKSTMAKWKRAYGDYPKVGQEVFLTADVNGYYQFAC